jgi:sugar phosphate isomerase/epimerase
MFLKNSALAAGVAIAAPGMMTNLTSCSSSKKMKLPLGFQVWTIREKIVADFPGTLKMMAGLGYKSVEMCSPPGYESSGFGPLMSLKPKEMKQIINDAGLIFESSHYNLGELKNNLEATIDFALESGQKQMVLSSFWIPETATLGDWMKAADELNEMGLKAKEKGIQMAFHNHHMEFKELEGKLIYDELLKQFDPEYVKMQFQVAVISAGFKAADYFKKYPGRFISAHLADWSPELKKSVPCGQGIVEWNEFFATVKTGGVKTIYVEMDPETFGPTAEYLNNL